MASAKEQLKQRDVVLIEPDSIYVDQSIKAERIAPGAVIHPGCRLSGEFTSIGSKCHIGTETPMTIDNCQLGSNVSLAGGYATCATFLDGASLGSGAHVRPGTLLEECAGAAHSAGLKHTILMPFVTLGSLINFCDVMMAGGTDRSNHSEVGSSYVHFNYAPQQHKATPSLIGDVPNGVMLDRQPIFLGGQGGLVGPARITYGTTTAAGVICRRDMLQPGKLLLQNEKHRQATIDYNPVLFGDISRIVTNNAVYFGQLLALREWYRCVRKNFMNKTAYEIACYVGSCSRLAEALAERIKQLDRFAAVLRRSRETSVREDNTPSSSQKQFIAKWPLIRERLHALETESALMQSLHEHFESKAPQPAVGTDYLDYIRSLPQPARIAGTEWLQNVVNLGTAAFDIK